MKFLQKQDGKDDDTEIKTRIGAPATADNDPENQEKAEAIKGKNTDGKTREEIRNITDDAAAGKNVNGDNTNIGKITDAERLGKIKSAKINQGIKNALRKSKRKIKRKRKSKRKRKGKTSTGKTTTTGKTTKTSSEGSGGGGDDGGGGDGPDPPDPNDFEAPKKEGISINDELRLLANKLSRASTSTREDTWRSFISSATYKKLMMELKYFRSVNED